MKIIDKYMARELAFSFAGVLLVLTVILSLGRIVQSVELIFGKGVRLWDAFSLIFLLLPSSFQFTIPIALLVAVLITIGRISGDNEFTVWKSAGVSLFRFSMAVVVFSVLVMLMSFTVTFFVVPYCNSQTKEVIAEIIRKQASLCVEEGRFVDSLPGILIYANKVNSQSNEIENIFIADERVAGRQIIVAAKRAVMDDAEGKITLHLLNGSMHMTGKNSSFYRVADFAVYSLGLNLRQAAQRGEKTSWEMTFTELVEALKTTPEGRLKREMQVEKNKRITMPLVCLSFCFLALPLGIRAQRSVRSRGFTVGFSLALSYFLMSTGAETLAGAGRISPIVAAWLPLLLFSLIGVSLYFLAGREILAPSPSWFPRQFIKLRSVFRKKP